MKDTHGGRLKVWSSTFEAESLAPGRVYLASYDAAEGFKQDHSLTPKQARKLARKLLAAADEIDPPAIAQTHYAPEHAITDAELDEILGPQSAPYVPQAGDRVFVAEDAGTGGPGLGYVAEDVRGTVAVVTGLTRDYCVQVLAPSGLNQWVHHSCLSPAAADAPDVDPAEPRGGCCGGGC